MVSTVERTTTLFTTEQFAEMVGEDDRCELWRGVIVEMSPVKSTHSKVAFRLGTTLGAYALRTGVGEVWPGDAGLTIEDGPDTVVSPDLSFIPADVAARLSDDVPGFPRVVPPLAVEIKSPSDTEKEIAAKLAMYLDAGVGEIWWVRPRQRTITRHWPDRDPVVLRAGETVTDVAALPGFSMAVDDAFPPERPAPADAAVVLGEVD